MHEHVQALSSQMLERDRWPRERLLEYQSNRLQAAVSHAIEHSPYYREVLGTVPAGSIDLQQLPILTKPTLMAEFDRIVTDPRDEHNRPVPAGVTGHKVLVSTLFNRTFPLIRYEFSDLAKIAAGPCACGRPHLRLASLEGRREDVLNLPGTCRREDPDERVSTRRNAAARA